MFVKPAISMKPVCMPAPHSLFIQLPYLCLGVVIRKLFITNLAGLSSALVSAPAQCMSFDEILIEDFRC